MTIAYTISKAFPKPTNLGSIKISPHIAVEPGIYVEAESLEEGRENLEALVEGDFTILQEEIISD